MAYVKQDDDNINEDILTRKEFYNSKKNDSIIPFDITPRLLLEESIRRGNHFKLHSYQLFVRNFINPNTPYTRLYLKWETGTGKTIGSLSIAMSFIEYFRKENLAGMLDIGTIFIIGFSEKVFKTELQKYHEFGFISRSEKIELSHLKKMANKGSQKDMDKYRELSIRIKKRFGNRKGYGFFKFYGYKTFVNRLFKFKDPTILNKLTSAQIINGVASGKIKLDEELISQFKNSLLICDEIHNVYNSVEKNNWGTAIQLILNKEPTLRAVFLSATPINNSPTEIIDLANLLLPHTILKKEDYFNDKIPRKGMLEKLGKKLRGRVSFLRDVNPEYYPKLIVEGESLNAIPYLKFIRCPMSPFHYHTYKSVYTGVLAQDSQYLVDFALPNPNPNEKIGIYRTHQIKSQMAHAPQVWKDKYQINFADGKIIGNILLRKNIEKYSSKYAKLLDDITYSVKQGRGKIFVYHNVVHMSGVLFIEQLLLANGFIDEYTYSTDNTLCTIFGFQKKQNKF